MRKVLLLVLAAAVLAAACGEASLDETGTTVGEVLSPPPDLVMLLASDVARSTTGAPAEDLALVAGEDPALGAALLSATASVVDADTEAEAAQIVSEIVDPVGTFYRFGLPASLLHRAKVG